MVEWNLGAVGAAAASLSVPDKAGNVVDLEEMISSSPRPCVLVSEREISVLRRGLTKDGWKRSLYLQPAKKNHGLYVGAGILSAANQSLEIDTQIPERSGHYHHFFCECGTRLRIPDNLCITKEYTCTACEKTYSGEVYDGAIRYFQHQKLAGATLSLALIYSIEKDRAYADKAAEILVNYANAYPGPHTGPTTGGMLYQSICEAIWSIPLAQAYDLIYYSRSLSDEQRELIENNLLRPVAKGLMDMGIEANWGSWHLSAVGVIGLAIKDAVFVQYALDSLLSQITEQLGDDGLWPESVHAYHFYPLAAFIHFAEGCYRTGIDLYNWEPRPGKSLKAMFLAPLQYMYPSFRLPAINDGWYDSFLPLDMYEIAYRRWGDPSFAWALKKGYKFGEIPINDDQREHVYAFQRNSFYAFLFGRDLPGRSGIPILKSHDFPVLGICTLRDPDGSMVTFDYGPFMGHGHLDKLGFTFYADDKLLIPDYGTPGYGSDIIGWYRSTASHNTVVVDGNSQEPSGIHGLTARHGGSFLQFAEAVARDHYPGITQTRKIVLIGKRCFVIDDLESETEHEYDWIIRCGGIAKSSQDCEPCKIDCVKYPRINMEKTCTFKGFQLTNWECENSDMTLAMWINDAQGQIGLGTCPGETADRPVSVYLCRQQGRTAHFTALLASHSEDKLDISKDGCAFKMVEGDDVDYIYLKGSGDVAINTLLETDGEVAAVRMCNNEVYAIALIRGSWMRWMGDLLLECPSTVDCVEISFKERNPLIRYCCDTAGVVKLKTNARAMRINGHRTSAATSDGRAMLRVTPQMLISDTIDMRS